VCSLLSNCVDYFITVGQKWKCYVISLMSLLYYLLIRIKYKTGSRYMGNCNRAPSTVEVNVYDPTSSTMNKEEKDSATKANFNKMLKH